MPVGTFRRSFDTTRSPLGELLYKLKNRGDEAVVPEIVDTAATFVKGWGWRIDAIVPVPPSNTARKRQPVIAVAIALSDMLGLPVCEELCDEGQEHGATQRRFRLRQAHRDVVRLPWISRRPKENGYCSLMI